MKRTVLILLLTLAAIAPSVFAQTRITAEDYFNTGVSCHINNDYDRAVIAYTEAINRRPDFYEAYFNRGIAYQRKDDYDMAIADYTKAIEINTEYVFAYYNRGIAYCYKGDFNKAIAEFEAALLIDPNNAAVRYVLELIESQL